MFLRRHGIVVGISCLLHVGLVAGMLQAAQWLPPRLQVVPVELIMLETVTPEPPAPTTPPKPLSRILPRLRPVAEPAAPAPPPVPAGAQEEPRAPVAGPAPQSASVAAPREDDGAAATHRPPAPVASPGDQMVARASIEAPTELARPKGGYQVRPSYPSSAKRLGAQGTTLLRVHVLADGRVGEVLVQESAGHSELDRAAAEAVRQWRFEPARRGPEAVAMWVLLPVEFRLR
jgi:periplasmic protein TonB